MPDLSSEPIFICTSDTLKDGGLGKRFALQSAWGATTGFVVRHAGQLYAYLNQCAHVPVEMDWQEGAFFTDDPNYLICATHGAIYETVTGTCVAGPCKYKHLHKIDILEQDGQVYWVPNQFFKIAKRDEP